MTYLCPVSIFGATFLHSNVTIMGSKPSQEYRHCLLHEVDNETAKLDVQEREERVNIYIFNFNNLAVISPVFHAWFVRWT